MSLNDVLDAFDELDPQQRGFVTSNEVFQLYSSLMESSINEESVKAVIQNVCGQEVCDVSRNSFINILEELERRRAIENEAYWDFQALDSNGNNYISLSHALLLFREYHGDLFSLDNWNKFLESREKPDRDVYFDELRFWLSNLPGNCRSSTQSEIVQEESRLERVHLDSAYRQHEEANLLMDIKDLEKEREEERQEHIEHSVKRKLQRWHMHGLAAMLDHDDLGLDRDMREDPITMSDKESIKTSDILALLEAKYSSLQDRVLMEFASRVASMDDEKLEMFNKLKRMASKNKKFQDEELSQLVEKTSLPLTLLAMLGDLGEAESDRRQKFEVLRAQLLEQGKSEEEIDNHLRSLHNQSIHGEQICSSMLAQLSLRLKTEREAVLSDLHDPHSQGKKSMSSLEFLSLHYCRLLRQLKLLQEEEHMTSAGLAVGLAERPQEYRLQRFDWDRDRSEWLAKERLEARVGRRQIKTSTTNIDLDPLEKAGSVVLRTRLVEEVEQAQYLEREAMVHFLQSSEAKSNLDAAAGLSSEARQKKIRILRSRRQECVALGNSTANQFLLAEATALYSEERRSGMEHTTQNGRETTMPCIVLADLQQRQEIEGNRILLESLKLNKQELTRAILTQVEMRLDQLFPNIAFVTLGGLEIRAEDQDFLHTLEAKFKAMRDQVFVFGLMEKIGSEWKSMSKEKKQREISQQRKEEKRLRGEGHLQEMAQLIGPRSQALPSLSQLIGEGKTFSSVSLQQQVSKSDEKLNLLADLAARFDIEMEGLLSWLQHPDVKSLPSKVKYVQLSRLAAEKFIAAVEESYETSLLAVGLLERIGQPRSRDDQEKQLILAEKRFTSRKIAVINQEKLRSPPDEKLSPKDDNVQDLQLVLTRALLCRHYYEREKLLSVLQDPGMADLVEAAASMSPKQALSRLKELKTKRNGLNLNDSVDNEEQTYIFEEAGAIRAAQLASTLSKDLGHTVLLAEASTHLLAHLQDLQDTELKQLFTQFQDMSTSDISTKTDEEVQARKYNYCNNVMEVFTKFDGNSTEEFEKLVKQKYRLLLNLLVEESLCQQHGGRQAWDTQSQKQKIKIISALSAKATELWDTDNQMSLSSWMHPKVQLQRSVSYLMGTDRKMYQESLTGSVPGDMIEESRSSETDETVGPGIVADLHRRYKSEAAYIKNYLNGVLDIVPSDENRQLLYSKLTWEITLLASAQDFLSSALIVGLVERQTGDMNGRLEHDNARYHMLASHLSSVKHMLPAANKVKTDKMVEITKLQDLLLRTLHHKHVDEWMVILRLLSSKDFRTLQEALSVETELQRGNRITQLHCQRDKLDLKEKSKHHRILEEALFVRKESVRQRLSIVTSSKNQQDFDLIEQDINAILISQLLQFQLMEAQIHLEAFLVEDAEDLRENYAAIFTEISQGHVSNIALVAFTSLSSEPPIFAASGGHNLNEMEIMQAVDGKYDALKDQLFIQALIDQMGEAEWSRLSDLERQRLLIELKLRERRLCREGKYDEAAALLGKLQSSEEKIRKFLDCSKADHERQLRERLEQRRARLAQGISEEKCNDLEAEETAAEIEEERARKENILLYLDHCNEQEKANLLKRLGSLGDDHERAQQRQLELVRQHREERLMRQEDNINAVTLLMGMAKDQHDKSNLSKEEEKLRQQELARQRLDILRQRQRLQGDNLVRGETILQHNDLEENESFMTDGRKDEVILGLLDVRHARERNALIKLLDAHSDGDSRNEAQLMSDIEIKAKVEEHKEMFDLWRDSEQRALSDGERILVDSVGPCVEWRGRELEKKGEIALDEDVKVALLAQLQEIQEAEAGQAMFMLIDMYDDQVEAFIKSQQLMLTSLGHNNLASVLLELPDMEGHEIKPDGEGQDDLEEGEKTVVQALEKKFDAMREKFLIEALIQEMGEADWYRLSDLDRQKKLVELKMRERRLRREGLTDELAQLLGNFAKDSDRLFQFLGESAEDQKRRVQEKLALRKRLKEEKEAQGVMVDEEDLNTLVEEEDKKVQAVNILNHLDKQFETEKAALLSALRSQPDHLSREKKRQLELARFQREQRRLKKEEKLDSVTMIFALGEQNLKTQQQSALSERERQQELALQRLEALKQKRANKIRGTKSGDGEGDSGKEVQEHSILENVLEDSPLLQIKVMYSAEKLQTEERSILMDFISRIDMPNKVMEMNALKNNDLSQTIGKLQSEHLDWKTKTTKMLRAHCKLSKLPTYDKLKFQKDIEIKCEEQLAILEKALAIKIEMERRRLESLRPNLNLAQIKEELSSCAVTALLERQQKILARTKDHIKEASVEDLKKSYDQHQLAHKSGIYPALSATCLHVCLASDLLQLMQGNNSTLIGHDLHDMEMLLADEYNNEKEELLQIGERESINVGTALKRLEEQYEHRKMALKSDLARQQADLRERVARRNQVADDMAWERAAMTDQLFATSLANLDSAKQAKRTDFNRQNTLLQQRLEERRAAKEAEKSIQAAETEREEQAEKSEMDNRLATPTANRRFSMPAMSREKSVVDVNVTEDQKQAMYDQLLQQERYKHDQITAAQARQEMMLKKRLEDRTNKRENEVAALFSLGERQKTSLQEFKKGERERQLAQMQHRMTRMRESRSQSPAKRGSESTLSK